MQNDYDRGVSTRHGSTLRRDTRIRLCRAARRQGEDRNGDERRRYHG